MARKNEDESSLKRLGGGRWQTRDERFTIEPESGTWVVVDAQQTDDLGLPLVRGPFSSLAAAKAAIEGARTSEPAVSPLAAQVEEHRKRPVVTPVATRASTTSSPKPAAMPAPKPAKPEPPPEPKWIRDLDPTERKRALELIERLIKAGAPDPEDLARREMSGKRTVVAAFAIARALAALGPDAKPPAVARLLAAGDSPDLGVRWRLVDDDGRPIALEEVQA
jgi:hypothetical protein